MAKGWFKKIAIPIAGVLNILGGAGSIIYTPVRMASSGLGAGQIIVTVLVAWLLGVIFIIGGLELLKRR